MDRSLDEIIGERPRGPRRPERRPGPPRGPRREEYPRDGVRKNRREERSDIDTDWVHDRFEDDGNDRRRRGEPNYDDETLPPRGPNRRFAEPGTKLRVDSLHYELTDEDVHELFSRIGPVASARLLYDKSDRSRGTAFVTYRDPRDAKEAIQQFNGANANGQPIQVTLVSDGPRGGRGGGSLFDRVDRPGRSLFERVESGRGRDDRDDRRGPRRARSYSPDGEDYYYRGERREDRSPMRARGPLRERGRRPGARREDSGRNAPRQPRTDEAGRPIVGGRPKKTAAELDAEMADYWDKVPQEGNGAAEAKPSTAQADQDIDMIE